MTYQLTYITTYLYLLSYFYEWLMNDLYYRSHPRDIVVLHHTLIETIQ